MTDTTLRKLETRIEDLENANDSHTMPYIFLDVLTKEPKSKDGMLVFADGVSWNPGNGRGGYLRENSVWVKL